MGNGQLRSKRFSLALDALIGERRKELDILKILNDTHRNGP
jgi:hypothetical protein